MEGLLAVVGLEVTTKGIRTSAVRRDRRREFQSLVAETLKLRAPNESTFKNTFNVAVVIFK